MNTLPSPSDPADRVLQLVQFSKASIFLTGKAGTGKTTLVRKIREESYKQLAVVAPTGVAAIQAGGVTIHSFLRIHPHSFIPDYQVRGGLPQGFESAFTLGRNVKLTRDRIAILKRIELLVIDEISMVRADLLDAMDAMLRKYRENPEPFGGVQLLMVGDLLQLPPVVKEEEMKWLGKYYPSMYFFESKALQRCGYIPVSLETVYRQQDPEFVGLLNELREGRLSAASEIRLHQHIKPRAEWPEEGYIVLCTHVKKSEQINQEKLLVTPGELHRLEARIEGDFPLSAYPAETQLQMKVGAQVMFIKNNWDLGYFNGKIGWVEQIDDELECIVVRAETGETYAVYREEWQNNQFGLDAESGSIKSEIVGSFWQFPLRLAWAITVHKSQGLTFSKAIIDVGSAFAPGQVYVALSRCRSLDGIILGSEINRETLFIDEVVLEFQQQWPNLKDIDTMCSAARSHYLQEMLHHFLNFGHLQSFHLRFRDACAYLGASKQEKTLQEAVNIIPCFDALSEVARKYRSAAFKILDEGLPEDAMERLFRAAEYFREQLFEHIAKPMIQIDRMIQEGGYTLKVRKRFEELVQELPLLARYQIIVPHLMHAARHNDTVRFVAQIEAQRSAWLELLKDAGRIVVKLPVPDPEVITQKRKHKRDKGLSRMKARKGQSIEITVEAYLQGQSLDQISAARKLSKGTVESHIFKALENGHLRVDQVMSDERQAEVEHWIRSMPAEAGPSEMFRRKPKGMRDLEIRIVRRKMQMPSSAQHE
jgi:hypothetical protein